MNTNAKEFQVRAILERVENAWRLKEFDGLEDCFEADAIILGPDHAVYAQGQSACAESYREFASNAAVLDYIESGHVLRMWRDTAVYTFQWKMTYQRDDGPKKEAGTDQLVLSQNAGRWCVVFRYIHFRPQAEDA